MRKEFIDHGGPGKETAFRAEKKFVRAPKVVGTFTQGGVLFYKDDIGGVHDAATYDRVFGKRDSSAILPKRKSEYQKIFKP
jgi:hypothetical protein